MADPTFERLQGKAAEEVAKATTHVFGKPLKPAGQRIRCSTEPRGTATPGNRDPLELVVDAPSGTIRLWGPETTLRWRFQAQSLQQFTNPAAVKAKLRVLLAKGIDAWKSAVPVKFKEDNDAWDFEVVLPADDDCDRTGCTLASAFFPDGGRHELVLYPLMFEQDESEQIATLAHEFGHTFGLRHFFAQVSETDDPSVIFGTHVKFTIMNYDAESVLTQADQDDLKLLYDSVWSGSLTKINGTRIQLVKPFSTTLISPGDSILAATKVQSSSQQLAASIAAKRAKRY